MCVCVCACVCVCMYEAQCMNSCMGGIWPAWPRGGDMGGWMACLPVELLVEGTICILAFYYIGYTPSGQIIMCSQVIIIWSLSVYTDSVIHYSVSSGQPLHQWFSPSVKLCVHVYMNVCGLGRHIKLKLVSKGSYISKILYFYDMKVKTCIL